MGIAGMRGDIRSEWDETKQHDVLFLLTIRPPDQAELALMQQDGAEPHPAEKFGLAYVRGCEVMEVKDEGTVLTIIACAAVNACYQWCEHCMDSDVQACSHILTASDWHHDGQ